MTNRMCWTFSKDELGGSSSAVRPGFHLRGGHSENVVDDVRSCHFGTSWAYADWSFLNTPWPRNIPVIMLTAHALGPEKLKESIELGARAYLPKDQLGRITPFSRRRFDPELWICLEIALCAAGWGVR